MHLCQRSLVASVRLVQYRVIAKISYPVIQFRCVTRTTIQIDLLLQGLYLIVGWFSAVDLSLSLFSCLGFVQLLYMCPTGPSEFVFVSASC